jgi:antitoxin (DNA-binding transcriptional repressor) of toxin-antitoxin stability system
METTLDYAETHFAQILRCVVGGEEVLLRSGTVPVARIVPISCPHPARPRVGQVTSGPVRWSAASFNALDDDGMKELGLL